MYEVNDKVQLLLTNKSEMDATIRVALQADGITPDSGCWDGLDPANALAVIARLSAGPYKVWGEQCAVAGTSVGTLKTVTPPSLE